MFAIPAADLTGRQRPDAFESTAKCADANAAPGGNHAGQEKLFGSFIPADPFLPGSGVIAIMIKWEYRKTEQ